MTLLICSRGYGYAKTGANPEPDSPAGFFAAAAQATVCAACAAGKHIPDDAATACTDCGAGKYSAGVASGTVTCTECLLGEIAAEGTLTLPRCLGQ